MPNRSSTSVRHDAVPLERVVDAARAWVTRMRAEHREIVRVGYFGSYATGRYVPGSDFDVLIEVSERPSERRGDRADRYRPERFPVGVELFVYTGDELDRARRERSAFIGEIDRHILWLE